MPNLEATTHAQTFSVVHGVVTNALSKAYSDAVLTGTSGQSRTNIIWTFGHLAWSYDIAQGTAIGLQPALPARYSELFGFGTAPSSNLADYPSLDEIKADIETAAKRNAARIAELTESELHAPLPAGHPLGSMFPTVSVLLSVGSFHTGYHLGQIGLLLVAQGQPSLLGA